jgi:hypothetical protein
LSLSPGSITAGQAASFPLTVNGSNFVPGATVNWNGSALATIVVSAFQVTATVLAGNVAAAGTASVTVANPSPGGTCPAVAFTINGSNLTPTISSLSPASGPAGGAAFTLTVQGSNFVPASTVNWNGTALAITYVSDTELTAPVPATEIVMPARDMSASAIPRGRA